VRLRFQERPWDLHFVLLYTVIVSAILLGGGIGTTAAILLVLFTPGYMLVAALFPTAKGIDWVERIGLSAGLSIAVVPLLGLILNATPFGFRFGAVVAATLLFTCVVGLAAYWRRLGIPPETRLSGAIEVPWPRFDHTTRLDKALAIVLATGVVVAASLAAEVLLAPRPVERFTEFYVLGPNGAPQGYPTRLNISEASTVILEVVNRESVGTDYTVRVDLVGVQIVFNETVELNRTTWSWYNFTLDHGRSWTQTYTISIDQVGLWAVEFLLYRERDLSSPYLRLRLPITVDPP